MTSDSKQNRELLAPAGGGRFVLLDFSRGLAALSILIFHHYQFKQFSSLYSSVDFFFVLSGFVLLPSIERVTSYREAASFIKIRAVRLLPMSIATLIFALSIQKIVEIKHAIYGEQSPEGIPTDPQTLLFAFLLLQVFSQTAQWLNGPLWSLSVEWLSNIIFALLSGAQKMKYVLSIIIAVVLQVHSSFGGEPWELQLGRGLFAFTIGALTRKYLYRNWENSHLKSVLSVLIFLSFHLLLVLWSSNLIIVAPFVFAFLILNAAASVITSSKVLLLSEFLGRYSYGFYAWHFPLLMLVPTIIRRPLSLFPHIQGWTIHIVFLATIAASLFMTSLIIRFIEPKTRRLFLPR